MVSCEWLAPLEDIVKSTNGVMGGDTSDATADGDTVFVPVHPVTLLSYYSYARHFNWITDCYTAGMPTRRCPGLTINTALILTP